MSKYFRLVGTLLMSILLVGILYINVGIYYKPVYTTVGHGRVDKDLLAGLQFLKSALADRAAEDMQHVFPEGYVFIHALYGLAWCEVAAALNPASELYREAHTEIQYAYDHLNSEAGMSIFSEYQILPRGAFYNGWSNYLLACKLGIEQPAKRDLEEVVRFKTQCESITQALSAQESPFLTSYPAAAWPADMVMCMAALAAHDKLFNPRYKPEIGKWLAKVKSRLDSQGLIPHQVHHKTGAVVEEARGCSQSLMLCFLSDIDPEFGRDQYRRYRALFLDHRFGLPGIREYPSGSFGLGDIDSGPVFLQMGSVASIVGIRTLSINGDRSESIKLRCSLEPFAVPFKSGNQKKFFFGQMPMADAFLAWGHAAGRSDDKPDHSAWRMQFHVYSAALVFGLVLAYWFLKRISPREKNVVSKSVNQ